MPDLTEVSAKGDEKLTDIPEVTIAGPVEIAVKPSPSETVTTAEEDRHTKSARNINLIWEVTQAAIALLVVIANVASGFIPVTATAGDIFGYAFFLVIGFYFSRTNHARTGGVSDVKK